MIYSNTYHHLFTHQPSDSPSPYAIKAAQPPPPPLTGKGSQHQHQATLQPLIPPVKKTITGKQQQQPQPQPKQQPLMPQKSAASVPAKAAGKSEKKQQPPPPQQPNPKAKPAVPAADTLSLGKRVALAVKRRSKVSLAEQGNSVGLGKERGGGGQTPKVTVMPSDANGEEDGISMLLAAQPPPKPQQPPLSPRPK